MKVSDIPTDTLAGGLSDEHLDELELALATDNLRGRGRLRTQVQLEQIRRGRPVMGPKLPPSPFRMYRTADGEWKGEEASKAGFCILMVSQELKRALGRGVPSRDRGKRLANDIPTAFEAGIDFALGIREDLPIPPGASSQWLRAIADGIEKVEKPRSTGSLTTRRVVAAGIELIRMARESLALPTWAELRARLETDEEIFGTAGDGDWRHIRTQSRLDVLKDGEAPRVMPPKADRKATRQAEIDRRIREREEEELRRWRAGE